MLSQARALGYAPIFFTVPHSLWLDGLPKSSLIVAGFSPEAGGPAAAKWFMTSVQPILLQTRAAGPRNTIWNQAAGGSNLMGLLDIECEPFDPLDPSSVMSTYDLDYICTMGRS